MTNSDAKGWVPKKGASIEEMQENLFNLLEELKGLTDRKKRLMAKNFEIQEEMQTLNDGIALARQAMFNLNDALYKARYPHAADNNPTP